MWPKEFKSQMHHQLGHESALFFESLQDKPPTSIRINSAKRFTPHSNWTPIPWHPDGYYLPKRPRFILDPLFHSGAYYVQEASSMVIHKILTELGLEKQPVWALDLCGAPGGKSTLLASALHPESFILCNESHSKRYNILKENIEKWGRSNLYSSNYDPQRFGRCKGLFDLVLVDAPCSGEGLFRKDIKAVGHWSLDHVAFCAGRQKRILSDAMALVKTNGYLIFSTCTYNQEENIRNATWVAQGGFQPVSVPLLEKFGFDKISDGEAVGYQAYPHKVKGEGFFVSIFQSHINHGPGIKKVKSFSFPWKKEKAFIPMFRPENQSHLYTDDRNRLISVRLSHLEILKLLSTDLRIQPTELGNLKGKHFVPSHGLALSSLLDPSLISELAVNKEQSLQFLRKETIDNLSFLPGWQRITFKKLGLGWIKGLGNRYNNYFPSHLRIRAKI
jgi:16S rRNA C967 or C1407 C5-methylase (RsmB/RsmF family)/NOL1/NOP2/fmu family ribosome biogenesis protein